MKLEINIRPRQKTDTAASWACYPFLSTCSVFGQSRKDAYSRIDVTVQVYLARSDMCLPREQRMGIA